MTEIEMLEKVGRTLFGRTWGLESLLAAALSVRRDTVVQWLKGRNRVPPSVFDDCISILEKRGFDAAELREWMKNRAGRTPGNHGGGLYG